jgi:hypothetical protein
MAVTPICGGILHSEQEGVALEKNERPDGRPKPGLRGTEMVTEPIQVAALITRDKKNDVCTKTLPLVIILRPSLQSLEQPKVTTGDGNLIFHGGGVA